MLAGSCCMDRIFAKKSNARFAVKIVDVGGAEV